MLKALTLATTAVLFSTAAVASDFNDRVGTGYLNLKAGFNEAEDNDFIISLNGGTTTNEVTTSYKEGFVAGVEVGQNVGPFMFIDNVKLGAEVNYNNNEVESHSVDGVKIADSDGRLLNWGFMLNMAHEYDTGTFMVPYYGLGVGFKNVKADDFTAGGLTALDDHDTAFAYQGNAGVAFMVADNMDIDLNYRYTGTEGLELTGTDGRADDFDVGNHNFTLGLRTRF